MRVSPIRAGGVAPTKNNCTCFEVAGGPRIVSIKIESDPAVINHAFQEAAEGAVKATPTNALQVSFARQGRDTLRDLLGKLEWDRLYDYKSDRSRE